MNVENYHFQVELLTNYICLTTSNLYIIYSLYVIIKIVYFMTKFFRKPYIYLFNLQLLIARKCIINKN